MEATIKTFELSTNFISLSSDNVKTLTLYPFYRMKRNSSVAIPSRSLSPSVSSPNSPTAKKKAWTVEQIKYVKRLKRFNGIALFLSVLLICFGIYSGVVGNANLSFIAGISTALGVFIAFQSILGLGSIRESKKHRMLNVYYAFIVVSTTVLLMATGYIFVQAGAGAQVITATQTMTTAQLLAAANQATSDTLSLNIIGIICTVQTFFLFLNLLWTMNLLPRRRAYITLLNIMNGVIVPIGFVVIVGAVYVIETAATIDAPETAFSMFVVGIIMILVCFMGLFGYFVESKGLINIYAYTTFVLAIGLIGGGIYMAVSTASVLTTINSNWNSIRKLLPPTFTGKYDINYFKNFCSTNLNLATFILIVAGFLFSVQSYSAFVLVEELDVGDYKKTFKLYDEDGSGEISMEELRNVLEKMWERVVGDHEIGKIFNTIDVEGKGVITLQNYIQFMKYRKEQEQEFYYHHPDALKARRRAESARQRSASEVKKGGTPKTNPYSAHAEFDPKHYEMPTQDGLYAIQQQWQSYWTYGSYRTVLAIKISCSIVLILFILAISAGVVIMGYDYECLNYVKYNDDQKFTGSTQLNKIIFSNDYIRGSVTLTLDNTITSVDYEVIQLAISASAGNTVKPSLSTGSSGGLTTGNVSISQPSPYTIGGYDFSCHNAYISAAFPGNSFTHPMSNTFLEIDYTGNYGSVDINFPSGGLKQPFNGLYANSLDGTVNVENVAVLNGGMKLTSSSGDIFVSNATITCSDILYGDPNAALTAQVSLGSIEIDDTTVFNCGTKVYGGQGLVTFRNFNSLATSGTSSFVVLNSDQGFINVTNANALDLSISSARGSIQGATITVPNGPLKVITNNGDILLSDIDVGNTGLIQVESSGGNIDISIRRGGFVGSITLQSQSGQAVINSIPGQIRNKISYNTTADGTGVAGSSSCSQYCAYYGEMIVSTGKGNINLTFL